MHIQRVYLENFGPHDALDVNLPKNGLFLITGQNGSGKSTLVEAVSWAIWGKTLRGAAMYRKKQHCLVRVFLDTGVIERSRSKSGKGAVSFTDKSGNCTEFDTAADAQAALVQMVGDAGIWRRTHIFSSNDPILFSSASDGDKKRLLETLLGLDKFDSGLAECRKKLADAKQEFQHAEIVRQSVEDDVDRLSRQIDSQKESLDALTGGEAQKFVQTTEGAIDSQIIEAVQRLDETHSATIELESSKAVKQSEFITLRDTAATKKAQFEKLKTGRCFTCGQPISEENLCTFEKEATQAHEAVEARKISVRQEISDIDSKLQKLDTRKTETRRELEGLRQVKAQLKTQKSRQILEKSAKETRKAHRSQKLRLSVVGREVQEKHKESEILKYTEAVLGLKGVRAHVLSNALGGIESAANAWLGRISEKPMKIRLSASDKGSMALEVEGVGGGNGYKGSSGGERRRIDIALLLALADVAAGATHADPGTLFLDEVLDAIDDEGVGLLSSALQEVAARRPIILITHSETLAHAVSQFAADHLNLRAGNERS